MDSSPRTRRGSTPKPETKKKFFSLEHANRTLPLVRRIVSDIVAQYTSVTALQDAIKAADAPEKSRDFQQQYEAAVDKLRDFGDELADIGCELKDWQRGLVDFPAMREGREINLCWQLGEDAIGYWHELEGGVAGRQPVDESF